jgi:hypothetical protein
MSDISTMPSKHWKIAIVCPKPRVESACQCLLCTTAKLLCLVRSIQSELRSISEDGYLVEAERLQEVITQSECLLADIVPVNSPASPSV